MNIMNGIGTAASSPFAREPLKEIDGIPMFSEVDSYVDNYFKIATDHIQGMTATRDNPWIDEEDWLEMEEGTLGLALKYARHAGPQGTLRLLDIGVGLGRLLKKIEAGLAGTKAELHGMDIALPYLKRAREQGINVVMSRIEDIPYQKGYFDIVTCTDVLEHVLDLNLCVRNCLSVVKPGGYLIVRVPNRENLGKYLQRDYPYEYAHLRAFDCNSLELLFTRIFREKVLEFSSGLYLYSYSLLKYPIPVRGWDFLHKKLLGLFRKMSRPLHRKLLERVVHSVEINVVVQKR